MKSLAAAAFAALILICSLELGLHFHQGEPHVSKGPGARLLLVGDSNVISLHSALQAALDELGVAARVDLLPQISTDDRIAAARKYLRETDPPDLLLFLFTNAADAAPLERGFSWTFSVGKVAGAALDGWLRRLGSASDVLRSMRTPARGPTCASTADRALLETLSVELVSGNSTLEELEDDAAALENLFFRCGGDPEVRAVVALLRHFEDQPERAARLQATLDPAGPGLLPELGRLALAGDGQGLMNLMRSHPDTLLLPAARALYYRLFFAPQDLRLELLPAATKAAVLPGALAWVKSQSSDPAWAGSILGTADPALQPFWTQNEIQRSPARVTEYFRARSERFPISRHYAFQALMAFNYAPDQYSLDRFRAFERYLTLVPDDISFLPAFLSQAMILAQKVPAFWENGDRALARAALQKTHADRLAELRTAYDEAKAGMRNCLRPGAEPCDQLVRRVNARLMAVRVSSSFPLLQRESLCSQFRVFLRIARDKAVPWVALQNPSLSFSVLRSCLEPKEKGRAFDTQAALSRKGPLSSFLAPDGVHLNPEGAQVLARQLAAWLKTTAL